MKTLKYKNKEKGEQLELVAYAISFISFILPKVSNIKEIILFGSVARGEAEKNSDIDLFFNVENKENEEQNKKVIERELRKFYKSKIAEIWFLKGVKNPLKVNIGKLDEWKLKRSLISEGISLYGRYKEMPKNLKGFVYFNISPIRKISKRNKVIRKLFGRKEKNYSSIGILNKINGKRLSPTSFIVPLESSNQIINLMKEEKIEYKFFEIWTD